MSLKSFLNGILKSTNQFLASSFSDYGVGGGHAQPMNFDRAVHAYKSWVYRCSSLNAGAIAQTPLRLYGYSQKATKQTTEKCLLDNPNIKSYIKKSAEIEEVEEHPFLDLMKNVNPHRNAFDLKYETQLFLELTGNSYWYLVPSSLRGINGNLLPAELWVLPSNRVKIVADKKEYIKHFEFSQRGVSEDVKFSTKEIIHFRFPNPIDILYGTAPLQAAVDAVDVNQYMRDYERGLLKNQARPDFIVKVEKGMNADQRKRFKEMWQDTYGGARKAGKFGIIEGGMDVQELGFSPKELNFLVGRKVTRDEIANIFGVPISKLTTDSVNLANAFVGERQYAKDTVMPRLKLIEEKLNEKLLPLYDDKLFCVFDNPVPEDKEFRLKERESNLKTGYASINMERKDDGQKPVEWGELPFLPMNLMPVGSSKSEVEEISARIAERIKERMRSAN